MTATAAVDPTGHHAPIEVLLVDDAPETDGYAAVLRDLYGVVNVAAHQRTALQYLQREHPALVVTGMTLDDGSAIDICHAAKAKPLPPSVLVISPQPDTVPEALIAGCDGVLIKPFATSILVNRVSRMIRMRAEQLRLRSALTRNKAAHLFERSELAKLGTNKAWPATSCPYCSHQGVTSFDYAGNRRAWYACLECRKVWMAKRQE